MANKPPVKHIVPPPADTERRAAIQMGKRLVRLWPISSVFLLALGVFFSSQHLIHYLDRTAAVFDGAFIQRLAVAAQYFFASVLSSLVIVYTVFRTISRYLEHDGFWADFNSLTPQERIKSFFYIFTVLTCLFAFCIWLVPLA